jgi:hypothetical protein
MTGDGGQAAGHTLGEAASLLGVSERTLRRWIAAAGGAPCTVAQTGYPPFQVERRGVGLVVLLPDSMADTASDMSASDRTAPYSAGEVAQLQAQLAAAEHERDTLAADKAWLQERLERAEEERAELRRMLNLEQQTLAALGQPAALAAPVTVAPEPATTGTEKPENRPAVPGVTDPTAIAAAARDAAKQAGIKGKKVRRRFAERLAALLGRQG